MIFLPKVGQLLKIDVTGLIEKLTEMEGEIAALRARIDELEGRLGEKDKME